MGLPDGSEMSGRRVFLTGAASGIGRATAFALAAKGAHLCLTDVRADDLAEVVEQIRGAGGVVRHAKAADISDYEQVRHLADEIHDQVGTMQLVMNIAGVSTWGTVEELEHRQWKSMVDVNLMGPIHVIEAFIPAMVRAGRGGHLVNVSSAAGLIGLPWHAAYSASKFGLRGVSEVLRFDLRRHRIGVTLVCPGAVATPLTETVEIAGVDRENPTFRRAQAHFHRRAVTPEKAAEAILSGVRKKKYLVYTSRDIFVIHWIQRKFSPVYELAMRVFNSGAHLLLTKAGRS